MCSAEKRIAVAVDGLRGRQEIVIKPLDDVFGTSYGIAGASVLGDGRVVLIVDVPALWNEREDAKSEEGPLSAASVAGRGPAH
ncbi:MAG: chemotaxis protein CheW [Nitrospirae bacterium]|nr:chemotaxis protein CheW [Nitrospirota bacterium]